MTTGQEDLAVSARNLCKAYFVPVKKSGFLGGLRTLLSQEKRRVDAVNDVSFNIRPGEFVGYIGPNGAGKSTTVKMLTGILHPTSGEVLVDGLSPQKQRKELARRIGVVFGQRTQLWWDLPTIDSFDILSAMYDVNASDYRAFLKEFDDLLGLGEFLDTPVRRLSLGQRMRAELAAALIHRPSILFLDEPTIGLDVVAKQRMREFLTTVNATRGVTVLLTTHDLKDIEELCPRVMIVNHGSLIYDGTLESLRNHAHLPTILEVKYYKLPEGLSAGSFIGPRGEGASAPLNGTWQIASVDPDSRSVRVLFDREHSPAPVVISAMQALGEIRDVSLEEPAIEDIIRRILEVK
ncbi:MAG TPA: ATP-binding cassette domain-containing protein [Firmicutes bacterium]|nr:ATP-binding cassette domain-containing protein [Candidatus Fermentithermobacillaceae bacterium]